MAILARDLGRTIRLLEDHVLQADGDPFGREMLRELARLIPADFIEFFELRERDRVGLEYVTSEDQPDPPPWTNEAFERWGHQNPLGAFKWQPSDGVVRLSSLAAYRKLRNLPLYEFYWGHHQIRDQLKIWLQRGPESAVCINFDRNGGTFSDRDVAILDVLRSHLMKAHARRRSGRAPSIADATLTRREAEVLSLAATGVTNDELAAALAISPGTVRKHLERAYEKLGVQNRVEAIAALRQAASR